MLYYDKKYKKMKKNAVIQHFLFSVKSIKLTENKHRFLFFFVKFHLHTIIVCVDEF